MHKVVVAGGSFAGLTAAFDLKRRLGSDVEVTVISKSDQFVFIPSLIWLVPGWRTESQISFPLAPSFQKKGIRFVHDAIARIEPERNLVHTTNGAEPYDYLVVCTGPYLNFAAVPGTGPEGGYTQSVCNLPHAQIARRRWQEYLRDPGDIVVGATQGASCLGAAYEMALNQAYALVRAGIRDKVQVHFVTPEPYVAHFGLGGIEGGEAAVTRLLEKNQIPVHLNVAVDGITPDKIRLSNGEEIGYRYAALIPPFMGIEAVRNSPGIGDAKGFIPVNDYYQHSQIDNIYAAGIAVALASPDPTPVPTGAPKTAYMSEIMARTAAHNIAARIHKEKLSPVPIVDIQALCLLDAGNTGVFFMVDRLQRKTRRRTIVMPGPLMHVGKFMFEKYFMWKSRGGRTYLP